jgi:hypothetical protein
MQFDGPAPEVINGRSAMLGFTAAVCGELYYQESVLNLLQDTPRSVILVFTLIMVGSLFPMGLGIHPQEKAHGIFTAENELWGGRLAYVPIHNVVNFVKFHWLAMIFLLFHERNLVVDCFDGV